jgi:hypothetical protein
LHLERTEHPTLNRLDAAVRGERHIATLRDPSSAQWSQWSHPRPRPSPCSHR